MKNLDMVNSKLKTKIKSKDYYSAVQILKEEIIGLYVEKIKQKDSSFKYTDILGLIEKTKNVLTKEEECELNKYLVVTNDECCVEYELHNLMDIYSELMKGGNNNDF